MRSMIIKKYQEMVKLKTFEERFLYLKLHGDVGFPTFGPERELNQRFYQSKEWRNLRNQVIVRDNGCDLAFPEMELLDKIYIHHINPILPDDFSNNTNKLFDLNNLVCVSFNTHQAIHYGNNDFTKISGLSERKPNDTRLW